jgi:hypothetical protein
MMTRLNISISDISDSLSSLQAQGLINKKTTNQGIECWFPTGPQAAPQMTQPMQVPASHLATQPTNSIPLATENRVPDRMGQDSRFSGLSDQKYQIPDPASAASQAAAVQVQHIPMAEPAYHPLSHNGIPPTDPAPRADAALYGLPQAPKGGVGFLALALGLVAAVAISTWLSGRLAGNAVNRAARDFVDKKTLTETTKSFAEFQDKTKTHITALEAEIKKLTEQLAAKAPDSLPAGAGAAKAEEAPTPKGKAAKKAAVAKSKAASTALSKAAARGAAKKRKATAAKPAPREESFPAAEESGPSESSPSVPNPPGLEELPPPPAE